MDPNRHNTNPPKSDKILWLADHIFKVFVSDVTGLQFYTLDCGCIYFQRIFKDGNLGSKVGIYRDADDGPCDVCMQLDKSWEDRVIDEVVVYNSKIEIETS